MRSRVDIASLSPDELFNINHSKERDALKRRVKHLTKSRQASKMAVFHISDTTDASEPCIQMLAADLISVS